MPPEEPSSSLEAWEAGPLAEALKRFPERKKGFPTSSGIEMPRVESAPSLPLPGVWPFTRGVQPTMYRSRIWTMRQYAGFSTPKETNARFRALLREGQTGLSVAFDLPTQIGFDSDHERAAGEVGRVGVPINTLDDMDSLLDGIPLEKTSISMTINSTAIVLLAMLVATGKRRGVSPSRLRGTLQNDMLKEYVARGTYRFPPTPSLRLMADVFEYCLDEVPMFYPISVSGYHIREAGATAVQEVGFTLAHGIAYLEEARKRGMDLRKLGERISFFFGAHNNLLEEVAKFRAARRMWARITRERFGIASDKGCALRFHTQTAGSTLTSRQYEVNTIRVTLQALAAVLGGTQSLHTNARDEALGLPSEDSATLALRIQQVLARESGLAETVDPLGGAPLIERLTDEVEARATDLIDRIDSLGGAVEALQQGFQEKEIEESSYRYQKAIETGDREVVGVNIHEMDDETSPPAYHVDPEIERERGEILATHRNGRDPATVQRSLEEILEVASGTDNLVPPLVTALEAGVTLGEICAALEEVFGVEETRLT